MKWETVEEGECEYLNRSEESVQAKSEIIGRGLNLLHMPYDKRMLIDSII